ncbi:MAG: potassium transporter TrkG [Erysipelotrichaceae bacterium]|nr:potassium transporter TrkG [Erysipelotrichaceae bacterium]
MRKIISNINDSYLRKMSIPKLLVLSFLSVITVGTILLMLPIAVVGKTTSFIDALFTATSATCVTGLVTVNVASKYSTFGHIVILLLIQIGGLGLMTFISITLLFIRGKLDFKERLLLRDSLNKDNLQNLNDYIKKIIIYSFGFETLGALLLMLSFIPMFGVIGGIKKSIFLSVSAFCNAGIDVLGANSLIPYSGDLIINITIAFLIIAGGLGYAVWFDIHNHLAIFKRVGKYKERFKIHTKLVIRLTLSLIVIGMVMIFIFEYNNALKGMSLGHKILTSFFNSVTLRTAGFASIDYSVILNPTKLIMILFMLIGGSPGGTAGGIKTTTFFLIFLTIYYEFTGNEETMAFNRHIKKINFIKAYTIFGFYFFCLFVAMLILGFTNSNFLFIDLLFEAVSAIGTVGLSIGITTGLSLLSKIIIIILMFIGRLGPITIAYSIMSKRKKERKIKHPSVEIIVG